MTGGLNRAEVGVLNNFISYLSQIFKYLNCLNLPAMSKVRGIFPLFLVTTIGVANGASSCSPSLNANLTKILGIWVFGPSLKEQQQERDALEQR